MVEKKINISSMEARRDEAYLINYPNKLLLPLDITLEEEDFVFSFSDDELMPATILKNKGESRANKLRFLINTKNLYLLTNDYKFSLAPSNLYININHEPLVFIRDIKKDYDDDMFLEEYKALAGFILNPKYTFEDYLLGGKSLYKKNIDLKKLGSMLSIEETSNFLKQLYSQEIQKNKEKKTLVNKGTIKILRFMVPLLICLFLGFGLYTIRLQFFVLPYQNKLLSAHEAYMQEDYNKEIEILADINTEKLPHTFLYTLARSYVISEDLSTKQKKNILSSITLKTDDAILVYWIEIGRIRYEEAIDAAQRIGDDELLLYAYIKYSVYVKNDPGLSGEEKTTQIDTLNKKIEELQKKQTSKYNLVDDKPEVTP